MECQKEQAAETETGEKQDEVENGCRQQKEERRYGGGGESHSDKNAVQGKGKA